MRSTDLQHETFDLKMMFTGTLVNLRQTGFFSTDLMPLLQGFCQAIRKGRFGSALQRECQSPGLGSCIYCCSLSAS
jgi:hypothetical protein